MLAFINASRRHVGLAGLCGAGFRETVRARLTRLPCKDIHIFRLFFTYRKPARISSALASPPPSVSLSRSDVNLTTINEYAEYIQRQKKKTKKKKLAHKHDLVWDDARHQQHQHDKTLFEVIVFTSRSKRKWTVICT